MEAVAYLKYVRISPIKVKPVLDLIRGKDVETAMGILKNTRKGVCEHLIKLLKSAMANAENNFEMDASKLYISECPAPLSRDGCPEQREAETEFLRELATSLSK